MNAPNPNDRDLDALRRAQRAHEPSMEEILASIRAIIADDREPAKPEAPKSEIVKPDFAKPDAAKPETPARTEAASGPQIVYSNDAPRSAKVEPLRPEPAKPVVEVEAPAAKAAPEPVMPTVVWSRPRIEPISRPEPAPRPEPISRREPEPVEEPIAAVADETYVQAPLLSDETDRAVAAQFEALTESVSRQSTELVDRLTREMLRPMIKTWLDENLPNMVERLVRAEIQRVARGGR